MNRKFNPEMLKLIRKARGLTQAELSNSVNIPQGALSKLEQGFFVREPKEEIIDKLTKALFIPTDFFYQDERIFPPLSPFHRKRASLKKQIKDKIESIANIYRIHIAKLIEAVNIEMNIIQIDTLDKNPEKIAQITRQNLKIPYGPIDNIIKLLENNGIFIFSLDFETDKFDGITLIDKDNINPLIFINSRQSSDRDRFTLAHELGHFIMHSIIYDDMTNIEKEANAFAAEFLLPKNEIRDSLRNLSIEKLMHLKRKWKVSMQSLIVRAYRLKMITEYQYKTLFIKMSSMGIRKKEPIKIQREYPTLIKELIDVYFNELDYSKNELCKILCLYNNDFDNFYNFDKEKLKLNENLRLIK